MGRQFQGLCFCSTILANDRPVCVIRERALISKSLMPNRSVSKMKLPKFYALLSIAVVFVLAPSASADPLTNAGMAIDFRLNINPIILSNSDGSNTSEFMGTSAEELIIKDFINEIWAQAGIEVIWQPTESWNNTFANVGTTSPRPTSDLDDIVALANTAGLNDPDAQVLNMYFVEIAAGFPDVGENSVNGLAYVDGNGVTQHVGDNLPSFAGGRDAIASVIAHEIGHNLGLPHLIETENLMQPAGSSNPGERLNASQIATARSSFLLVSVPEPNVACLLVALGLAGGMRRRRGRVA